MEEADQALASNALWELFTGHGLRCVREQEWIVPNNQLPAIRAHWYSQDKSTRLDVEVLVGKGRIIQECFAGMDTGRSGFVDALNNFMVNSLHVLLAAFWEIRDEQQVLIEDWRVGGRPFTAYIGNFGRRATAGVHVDVPENLFDTLRHGICHENLSGDIHWFRTFFCNHAGQHAYESLRDNEPWEAGLAGLKRIAWPESDGYYSFRNFIVLRSA